MSLKKMLLSGAAALALMSSAAFAECDCNSTSTNVRVAQDGTGDYLLAPVYYAAGTWKTKLKVVNTNPNRAIVAKVVVRDGNICAENMDFAIYLSPGDVWEGTLMDKEGELVVVTTDDSFILNKVPASEVEGGYIVNNHHPLPTEGKAPCIQNNAEGYIEIVGLASYDPAQIDPKWSVGKPLNKKTFYEKVKGDKNYLSDNYDAQDVGNDDLMGKVTIVNDVDNVDSKRTMMLNLLAFENVVNKPVVGSAHSTIFYETQWSSQIGLETGLNPIVKLMQLDAAIAKRNIYIMYEGDGDKIYPVRTHLTAPTKKYWLSEYRLNPGYKGYDPQKCPSLAYYSINPSGSEVTFRDMQETVDQCHKTSEISGGSTESCEIPIHPEVYNISLDPTDKKNHPFEEYVFASGGYIDINLANNAYEYETIDGNHKVSFHGFPVIPTSFYANKVGEIYLNNWLYNQYKCPTDLELK